MATLIQPQRWGQQKPPAGATLLPGHPLAAGLVGAWLFHERGGTGIRELVGGQVGAAGTGTAWGPQGLTLDGTGTASVQTPWRAAFDVTAGTWVATLRRTAQTNGIFRWVLGKGSSGSSGGTHIYYSDLGAYVAQSSNGTSVTGATTPATGEWHQLAHAFESGGAVSLYYNNRLDATGSSQTSFTPGADPIQFGKSLDGFWSTPLIELAQVYYYARILNPAEIAWLYAEPYAMLAPPAPRLRYWMLVSSGVQYVYPASDVSAGGWTTDAGSTSNLYAAIDELFGAINDADYIQSPLGPSTAEAKVRLGTATGLATGHFQYVRAYNSVPNSKRVDLTVTLYATNGTTVLDTQTWTLTNTLTTYALPIASAADASTGLVLGMQATQVG